MYALIVLWVFASGGTSSENLRHFEKKCDCETAKKALEVGVDSKDRFSGIDGVTYYECRLVPKKK